VDSKGKAADQGALAARLVARGYGVFAVDLRGIGETRLKENSRDKRGGYQSQTLGIDAAVAYDGLELGRSIFAMRVYDLLKSLEYLCSRNEVDENYGVAVIGRSSCGPLALYAAALDDRVRGVLVDSSLVSFRELTRPYIYPWNFIDFLPGVLRSHDLPQVAGAVAPGAVWILNSLDIQKKLKEKELVHRVYEFTQGCYQTLGAEENFQIKSYSTAKQRMENYLEWIDAVF